MLACLWGLPMISSNLLGGDNMRHGFVNLPAAALWFANRWHDAFPLLCVIPTRWLPVYLWNKTNHHRRLQLCKDLSMFLNLNTSTTKSHFSCCEGLYFFHCGKRAAFASYIISNYLSIYLQWDRIFLNFYWSFSLWCCPENISKYIQLHVNIVLDKQVILLTNTTLKIFCLFLIFLYLLVAWTTEEKLLTATWEDS